MPKFRIPLTDRKLLRRFISNGGVKYPPLAEKLPELVGDDLKKCNENPRYFYNKYLRGKKESVVSIQEWVKTVEKVVKKIV